MPAAGVMEPPADRPILAAASGSRALRLVLFDLDGTLVDSAPDLAGAANELRRRDGLEPLPLAALRPFVGSGARGMLRAALGLTPGAARYDALRAAFLDVYEARLLSQTRLFDGIAEVLARLGDAGIGWGVVTNKHARFARPIVAALGLDGAAGARAFVAGDTTPHAKPHPAPLLEAARQAGVDAADAVYVGDDLRDMQAARAAAMGALVAAWGYLGDGAPPAEWGADALVGSPAALLNALGVA